MRSAPSCDLTIARAPSLHRLQCERASPRLREIVRAFAQREVDASRAPWSQRLPARLEQILEFQFAESYEISGACGGHVSPPRAAAIGMYTRNDCAIRFSRRILSFAIFFQPDGLSRLFGLPAALLSNAAYDARELLGPPIDSLYERLAECRGFTSRKAAAENFLIGRATLSLRKQGCEDLAAAHIFSRLGAVRLGAVAHDAGLGIRQFERRFLLATGVQPKIYARLARFQSALDVKVRTPQRSWIRIAHDLGYHDQMHMIRDFRHFGGSPPKQLVADLGDARPEALFPENAGNNFDHGLDELILR